MSTAWHAIANRSALQSRASMLEQLRQFFRERHVLEVETPILSRGGVTDPQIASLSTSIRGFDASYYLSPSPEFAMKRLLASGSGDIFQVCKAFRDAEHGRWHQPEFTMIEWYRLDFDDDQLMSEVEALVGRLLAPYRKVESAERLSYATALARYAGVDSRASVEELAAAAQAHGVDCGALLDRDASLDLLMGLVVGPKLGRERPTFIIDYPASQASLARLKPGSEAVAARFEYYIDGLELANGFHELANPLEQRRRFEEDIKLRRLRGQPAPAIDENLLDALTAGLPDCAGVALGFDRLVAIALQARDLREILAFDIENA